MGRECNKCVHRKEHGCEKWDCEFEPYTPTRKEAIRIIREAFDVMEEEYDSADDWEEEHEARDMAIKALEQEPCEDAVSREWALLALTGKNLSAKSTEELIRLLNKRIKNLPSVTPARKKGKWIYDKTIQNWRCSECNETPKTLGFVGTADFMVEHFRFCNHCGVKMKSEQDNCLD